MRLSTKVFGYQEMKRITSSLELGQLSKRSYYKHKNFITEKSREKSERTSKKSVDDVIRNVYAKELGIFPNENGILNIAVSYDGE